MNDFIDSTESGSRVMEREADREYDAQSNEPQTPSSDAESAKKQPRGKTRQGFVSWLSRRILSTFGDLPVTVVLPDDQVVALSQSPSAGKIIIRDRRTLLALALDPLFQFGEAYVKGKIEIEGDMPECLAHVFRCMVAQQKNSSMQRIMYGLRRPMSNSLSGSQKNIHHHYDLGNDFYQMWLDERMLYTCAYFPRQDYTLEQAQLAKMDHVCRKLRLQPGMSVVEAGCGWGGLALHMAEHYDVRVRAFNISKEQIAWARNLAEQRGLGDRVEFVQDDWRNIRGQYDAFVSVGMLEHVGVKNYRQLGDTIQRVLRPEGPGLIHTIGQNQPLPLNPWIERRIFPGAYGPSLRQMMDIFEPNNFQILDVENLRLHYAETLRHWLKRFEASRDKVREKFDERFVRTWRMYLAGSVAAFQAGCMQLYQVVFANGLTNNVPMTREHLYHSEDHQRATHENV